MELRPTHTWSSSAPAHWTAGSDTRPSVPAKVCWGLLRAPAIESLKGEREQVSNSKAGPAAYLPCRLQEPHSHAMTHTTLPSLLRGYQTNMDWEKEEGNAYPYYVYGAACSEVEVDCLTGAHKVERCLRTPPSQGTNAHCRVSCTVRNSQLDLTGDR